MGYDFAAQRVHKYASQLLSTGRLKSQPPWYQTVQQCPPSERLVRPPLQRPQTPSTKRSRPHRRSSRMFQPMKLQYEEDRLRWEYFNDHPWELARPRVILEDDGRDLGKWDWSLPLSAPPRSELIQKLGSMKAVYEWEDWYSERQQKQAARPINGESVVQRQNWLVSYGGMSLLAAYDAARKELYRARHAREIEDRVAREEALHMGGYFGLGPLDVGMQLEDKAYEDWKIWGEKQIEEMKQLESSAYTGVEEEDTSSQRELDALGETPELQEVSESIPGSRAGQTAEGGAAFRI